MTKKKKNNFLIGIGIIFLLLSGFFIFKGLDIIPFSGALVGGTMEGGHRIYTQLEENKLIYEGTFSKSGRDCETSAGNVILAASDIRIANIFRNDYEIKVTTWWNSFRRFDLPVALQQFEGNIPNGYANEGLYVKGWSFGSVPIGTKPADSEQCTWNFRVEFMPKIIEAPEPIPQPFPEPQPEPQPEDSNQNLKNISIILIFLFVGISLAVMFVL